MALALVSSSAGTPPVPAAGVPVSVRGQGSVTLGPSSVTDGGISPSGAESGTSALTPAVEPDIRPASPTQPLAAEPLAPAPATVPPAETVPAPTAAPGPAPTTAPSVEATAPAPVAPAPEPAPDVPSIPPLWAPDEELASPSAPRTAAPESLPPVASSEALISQSNAAAVLTVFNRINEYRSSKGLKPVKYNATVAGLAQDWSDNIASREVIEHRASFWTDPRALSPNNGAGEVIAIRTDRDAALLVEWWKGSPGHNAMLLDPRFNVMGAGISYTDRTYQIWGVVNFFGYTTLPAGTTDSPGGTGPGTAFPAPAPTMCSAPGRHMPPTLDLSAAAIKGPGDVVTVDSSGQLLARAAIGSRTFAAARVIGSGFAGAKEVFTTDWDRDGAFDLVTQWTSGNLTLHRGLAAGGFQSPVTLGSGGWETLTLAVGGWCANNRLPQILALDGAGSLYLYPNKGTGDLSARGFVGSVGAARKISMVDYDADGFQDVLALRTDGSVQLHRGWGTITLRAEARATVATGWGDVTGIRPLRDVTGLNSTGLALRRASDVVQYWDLTSGSLMAPSAIPGPWSGQRLAH
ncbi:CAP domain-containing protein [Arthrobacter sp. AFG7.2]|uniref:CAP domain-containing protein n=1 Tax=Arthrobacter sp. AFG7.2 TaxID=1688693 RepID=UPI001CB9335A|nr:CAP domain-containing protein [Arthrobacter sp. AFG7.2]